MLIIFGLRTTRRLLGVVTIACRGCGNPAAHRLEQQRRVLTLFFVPLIPLGRRTTLITCTFCARVSEVPADQVEGLVAQVHPRPGGSTSGLSRTF